MFSNPQKTEFVLWIQKKNRKQSVNREIIIRKAIQLIKEKKMYSNCDFFIIQNLYPDDWTNKFHVCRIPKKSTTMNKNFDDRMTPS